MALTKEQELMNTVQSFQVALNVLNYMSKEVKSKNDSHMLVNFQYSMKYILEKGQALAHELEHYRKFKADVPLYSTMISNGPLTADQSMDFLKELYKEQYKEQYKYANAKSTV